MVHIYNNDLQTPNGIYSLTFVVISMLLMIIPFVLSDAGIMHCLAVAPTLVMSVMFIVLYLVDQVHDMAEQLYLMLQITLNITALVSVLLTDEPSGALYGLFYCHLLVALCIDQYYVIKERGFALLAVVALLLNIIPHIVEPLDMWHCLVAAPTLMLSALIMVLYVVDQVLYEAEFYYIVIELIITIVALVNLFIIGNIIGSIYGLFYVDLIIAFSMDFYYIYKERGLTF